MCTNGLQNKIGIYSVTEKTNKNSERICGVKSKCGKLGGDNKQVEFLVAPLVGPKNSDSEGEEDSDSPVRERNKSGSLVSSRTRTRGWSESVIQTPLRQIVGLLGKLSMCVYCLLTVIYGLGNRMLHLIVTNQMICIVLLNL